MRCLQTDGMCGFLITANNMDLQEPSTKAVLDQLGQAIVNTNKTGEEITFDTTKELLAALDNNRANCWTNDDPAISSLDELNKLLDKLDPDTHSSSSK